VVTFANAEGYASIINGDDDARVSYSSHFLCFSLDAFTLLSVRPSVYPKTHVPLHAMLCCSSLRPLLFLFFPLSDRRKRGSTQPHALLVELVHIPLDPCV
jgi:hypothetical protein